MRYQMKQKLFAFGDDFTIKDDAGNDRFFVDGRAFSIGDKLSFQDMAGNELAFIRQKLLAWGPTYEIYRGGQLFAVIKQKIWTLFRNHFSVDVNADGPGPGDLEAQGDFLDHEYTLTRDGQPVASISKRWFAFTDTYGVDIAPGEDDVLILACTVVVDMATEKHRNRD
jgi:uncharacterized protein YxjI